MHSRNRKLLVNYCTKCTLDGCALYPTLLAIFEISGGKNRYMKKCSHVQHVRAFIYAKDLHSTLTHAPVQTLRMRLLPHLIWKDISIFEMNQIYLSFHLHPIRGENSHDALLNISHLGSPGAAGKAPCLILKQKPPGWAQLSDQNQPPLWIAVPKYCVLSKYLILTLCWKLIKYPAGGKNINRENPPFKAPHQRCGVLPTLVCYDPKITLLFTPFSFGLEPLRSPIETMRSGGGEPKPKVFLKMICVIAR